MKNIKIIAILGIIGLVSCQKPIVKDENRFLDSMKSISDTTKFDSTNCLLDSTTKETIEVYSSQWIDSPISMDKRHPDTFIRYWDTTLNVIRVEYIKKK